MRLAVLGGETGQAGFPLARGVPRTRGLVLRRLRAFAAGKDARDQEEENSQEQSSDQFHNGTKLSRRYQVTKKERARTATREGII